MSGILDKHASLKKLSKYKLKFKTKPWITMALQKLFLSRTTANIFNNYFSTIGEKTQAKTKHSHKRYTGYLTSENPETFFLLPTNKEEIKYILSSLDINKSTGPYSISSKIFEQIADLFNLLLQQAPSQLFWKLLKLSLSIKKTLNQISQIIVQYLF